MSRGALEGERKQDTVLFADLKGSMELLADRDPEKARQLLDPVLEHMMAAVHRYEGTVNQVTGDGIMALFGAPFAHEDHAVRACYAALAMQEALQRAIPMLEQAIGLCQDWHLPLFVPGLTAILGDAYALARHVDADLALAEQGVEQAAAGSNPKSLAFVVAYLSEVYLLAGRLEDAHQRAVQALDLARQYQQRGTQAWALWLLGESTARQVYPEGEPAVGHYRQALALAEELGMRPLQARCHRGLGTLYAQMGQRELARTALSAALALYRDMAMTFWLPQTEATLAQVEA